MTRRSRFATALALIATLLFAPLAMAVKACPHFAAAPAMEMGGGMPCHEMPAPAPRGPNLCDVQSDGAPASFQSAQPASPAPIAIVSAPHVPVLHPALMRAAPRGYDHPGPAPPHLRFTVLRI